MQHGGCNADLEKQRTGIATAKRLWGVAWLKAMIPDTWKVCSLLMRLSRPKRGRNMAISSSQSKKAGENLYIVKIQHWIGVWFDFLGQGIGHKDQAGSNVDLNMHINKYTHKYSKIEFVLLLAMNSLYNPRHQSLSAPKKKIEPSHNGQYEMRMMTFYGSFRCNISKIPGI